MFEILTKSLIQTVLKTWLLLKDIGHLYLSVTNRSFRPVFLKKIEGMKLKVHFTHHLSYFKSFSQWLQKYSIGAYDLNAEVRTLLDIESFSNIRFMKEAKCTLWVCDEDLRWKANQCLLFFERLRRACEAYCIKVSLHFMDFSRAKQFVDLLTADMAKYFELMSFRRRDDGNRLNITKLYTIGSFEFGVVTSEFEAYRSKSTGKRLILPAGAYCRTVDISWLKSQFWWRDLNYLGIGWLTGNQKRDNFVERMIHCSINTLTELDISFVSVEVLKALPNLTAVTLFDIDELDKSHTVLHYLLERLETWRSIEYGRYVKYYRSFEETSTATAPYNQRKLELDRLGNFSSAIIKEFLNAIPANSLHTLLESSGGAYGFKNYGAIVEKWNTSLRVLKFGINNHYELAESFTNLATLIIQEHGYIWVPHAHVLLFITKLPNLTKLTMMGNSGGINIENVREYVTALINVRHRLLEYNATPLRGCSVEDHEAFLVNNRMLQQCTLDHRIIHLPIIRKELG